MDEYFWKSVVICNDWLPPNGGKMRECKGELHDLLPITLLWLPVG